MLRVDKTVEGGDGSGRRWKRAWDGEIRREQEELVLCGSTRYYSYVKCCAQVSGNLVQSST
jgi:hypothetical protein